MGKYFFDFTDGDHSIKDPDGHAWGDAEALADAMRPLSHLLTMDAGNDREISCIVRSDEGDAISKVALTLELGEGRSPPHRFQSSQLRLSGLRGKWPRLMKSSLDPSHQLGPHILRSSGGDARSGEAHRASAWNRADQ